MLKKLAQQIKNKNFGPRTKQLKALAKHVSAEAHAQGLVADGDNCHTVCEEQLVIVNGKLQHKLVCHLVCTP